MKSASVPSSHIVCPTSLRSDDGWASEIVGRFSAPFCCNVAARAKKNAAISANVAAMSTYVLTGLTHTHVVRAQLPSGQPPRWSTIG